MFEEIGLLGLTKPLANNFKVGDRVIADGSSKGGIVHITAQGNIVVEFYPRGNTGCYHPKRLMKID